MEIVEAEIYCLVHPRVIRHHGVTSFSPRSVSVNLLLTCEVLSKTFSLSGITITFSPGGGIHKQVTWKSKGRQFLEGN